MRILFVAQAVSIHTGRWINQLRGLGWDIHLYDMRGSFPHPELRGITEYSLLLPRRIPSAKPVSYGNPFFMKYGLDPFPLSLVGFFTRRIFHNRVRHLAQLIQKIQPDIIHSMEMQAESYPLLDVQKNLNGGFSVPWIVTTWGSDIFYFSKFPEHLEKIRKVLGHCDYLIPDCVRDEILARRLGFKGTVPLILPGAGGYPVSKMRALIRDASISKRRLIMLKGYQGWAGRADNALDAIESCSDVLKGYEIVVYLASSPVAQRVKTLQRTGTLNIKVLPHSPHHVILEHLGMARVAIGINLTDGVPNAMLEAMTMGAFPIQSDTGSTSEWIQNGVNGLLVAPSDPVDIAKAIRKAIRDDALVENAAKINHRQIFQRLDLSVVRPMVIEMYQAVGARGSK